MFVDVSREGTVGSVVYGQKCVFFDFLFSFRRLVRMLTKGGAEEDRPTQTVFSSKSKIAKKKTTSIAIVRQ